MSANSMSKSIRNVLLALAWIGLIWMMVDTARDKPISEALWVNIVYVVGLLGFGIALWIGLVFAIGRRLPKPAIVLALASVIVLALLGVETFWLRDWLAGRL